MSGSSKMYGLLVPKKGALQPRHSVFGNDSSDDSGDGIKAAGRPQPRKVKAVLELDSSLLKYDEYHDELERERADQQKAKREGAQSRYVPLLMQQAERRKKEAERRAERLVQKEREAEGDQFHDKETFVTASYRKKVEEFARMDAEDRHQDRIEELADVTKQKDLGAFYGSLYKQTVDTQHVVTPELGGDQDKSDRVKEARASGKKSRHYRKRKNSSSSQEHSDSASEIDKEVTQTHGHGSRDESESKEEQLAGRRRDEEHGRSSSKRNKAHEASKPRIKEVVRDGDANTPSRKCVESGSEEGEIREQEEKGSARNSVEVVTKMEVAVSECAEPVDDVVVSQVEKVDIWAKHTVGEVFEAAVQRYWQRKAARDAAIALAK